MHHQANNIFRILSDSKPVMVFSCLFFFQSISLQLTAEKLEKRLELAESRLQKQEELSNRLEEELVTLDKEWENKLRKWTSSLVSFIMFAY